VTSFMMKSLTDIMTKVNSAPIVVLHKDFGWLVTIIIQLFVSVSLIQKMTSFATHSI
jgi:hypothetical protein